MTRIHDLLCREGFEGSYDAVRRYARRWAEARRADSDDRAHVFRSDAAQRSDLIARSLST
jgi:hypothetical protein